MTIIGNKLGSALRSVIDGRKKGGGSAGQSTHVDLLRNAGQHHAAIV